MTAEVLLTQISWVRRLARALVRDADDAADMAQQAFADALERPPRSATNLRGWLAQVTRNVARRMGRDARLREQRERASPYEGREPEPEEAVARAELQRLVVDAVLGLEEPYRSTLVLRYFEDLEATAIARATDVPVETVRTRVKRGLALVRARLVASAREDGRSRHGVEALLAPLLEPPMGAATLAVSSKIALAAALVLVVGAAIWWWHVPASARVARSMAAKGAPARVESAIGVAAEPVRRSSLPADPAPDPAAAALEAAPPLPESFDLVGVVEDSSGARVPEAIVCVGPASSEPLKSVARLVWSAVWEQHRSDVVDGRFMHLPCTRSDPAGRFRFPRLETFGSWRVAAIHPTAGLALADVGAIDRVARCAEARLTLTRGVVIHGRVLDEYRNPAKDACLIVVSRNGGWDANVHVQSDGTFRLPCVPPPQTLEFEASTSDGLESNLEVELRAEDPPERELEFVLRVRPAEHRLTGRLVALDGGKADLEHTLIPKLRPAERWELDHVIPGPVVVVGLAGETAPRVGETYDVQAEDQLIVSGEDPASRVVTTFAFELEIREDRYEVCTDRREIDDERSLRWIAFVARNRILGVASVPDDPPPAVGPDLVVDLSQLPPPNRGPMHVELREKGGGSLITSHCLVVVHVFEGGRCDSWDSCWADEGKTEFTGIGAGEAIVAAWGDGWMPCCTRLTTRAGEEPQSVVLELERAPARIRGEILGAGGRPIAGATVVLCVPEGGSLRDFTLDPQRTNADGCFAFEGIAAAPFVVVARADGFAPAALKVLADPTATPCRIELARGVTVRVRLAAPSTWSSCQALLRITDRAGVPLYQDWAYDNRSAPGVEWPRSGSFSLTLPEGVPTWEARIGGAESWTDDLRAVEGAEVVIPVQPRRR